jgi:hypothetical protein
VLTACSDELPELVVSESSALRRSGIKSPQHRYLVVPEGTPACGKISGQRRPKFGSIDELMGSREEKHDDYADVVLEEVFCRNDGGSLRRYL